MAAKTSATRGPGPGTEAKIPGHRTCALTRVSRLRHTLVRLVLGPDQSPFIDLLGRAPGRGVYVVAERAILLDALQKKGIGRVFKGKARPYAPDEAMRHVEDAVRRLDDRLLELISLGRRSGDLELGMDAVLRTLNEDGSKGPVLAISSDASDRTRERVEAAAARCANPVHVVHLSNDKVTVGGSLGRDEVAVVAMKPSKLADRLATEAERRAGLSGHGQPASRSEV